MKVKKNSDSEPRKANYAPAMTPEMRENQLISLAYDLVEKRLMEGTATSQETTHFLKLGSSKERLEREILEKQAELMTAKTEALKSAKKIEEMYGKAIAAMRSYGGQDISEENEDDSDIY